jgi:hypothetical protein
MLRNFAIPPEESGRVDEPELVIKYPQLTILRTDTSALRIAIHVGWLTPASRFNGHSLLDLAAAYGGPTTIALLGTMGYTRVLDVQMTAEVPASGMEESEELITDDERSDTFAPDSPALTHVSTSDNITDDTVPQMETVSQLTVDEEPVPKRQCLACDDDLGNQEAHYGGCVPHPDEWN